MSEKYTLTQLQRLTELNAGSEITEQEFKDADARNDVYKKTEKDLVKKNREKLKELLDKRHMPLTACIENNMTEWLTEKAEFTKVSTPIIITGENLDAMSITKDNPLREQVFWTGRNRCLRPMLAPGLYVVMRELHKITNGPVRIFECGSCFRKESQGAMHMNEFTMLNMVELAGTEEGHQGEKLESFARGAMEAVGIDKYEIVREKSDVYGETMDIIADGIELASGAYGPLPAMDSKWGVFDVWVGLGLGIERIAMVKGGYQTIKRAGKSIAYIDGIPFKL